ncbi:MAG TPA: SIS domain-containing protein [Steroidobacteraceae bacterium]|jgi:glucosamine--fructose-6-phosphate aminotransferase (isomerizing)|nr:SIS domain-containing protein [Steroidobacteraceae bacterium]
MSTSRAAVAEGTHMFREAASASDAVRAQLQDDAAAIAAIGKEVRRLAPRTVITCARGSSDHAATYAKYLIETRTGVITASAAPSVSSLYGVSQDLRGCLFIALSQSGRSPDLIASVAAAKAAGATILVLCNSPGAPLIAAADLAIELRAGVETSVAATKSYLATLAALLRMVAAWTQDPTLASDVDTLPQLMDRTWALDWSAALPPLESASNLYVVGRGLGLGAAQETALKCKETCGLHAEAFSSAEVRHGPYALLGAGFPALLFAQRDATQEGVEALGLELTLRGVPVLMAGAREAGAQAHAARRAGALMLPTIPASAEIGPILLVQSAYRLIATLAIRRGFDPDHPAHLRKVTETV